MLTRKLFALQCWTVQRTVLTRLGLVACDHKLFSSKHPNQPVTIQVDGQVKKFKRSEVPKITLISSENDMNIMTLDEAQQLSKRRDLRLVRLIDVDVKTQRPVYKLMTGTQYHAAEIKLKEKRKQEKESSSFIKGDKLVFINSNISQHDLDIQLNKILKWIKKKYEVRVVINGSITTTDKVENISKFLEKHLKDLKSKFTQQKKGHELKLRITPSEETDDSEPL